MTVYYSLNTSQSAASSGSDFSALSGSVVIPDGFSYADIAIVTIDDSEHEDEETVVLNLESGCCCGGGSYTVGSPGAATLTITDDDPPPNQAPSTPTDDNAAADAVNEGAANGTAVGVTALSTDPESTPVTFSLTDDAGGRFQIHATTGVVSVANGSLIDFESSGGSYSITVRASDGDLTAEQAFSISVNNVAPTAPTDDNASANEVDEGADNGTLVGLTVAATDPAGGTVTFALTDDAGGRFQIDSSTGVVSVADGSLIDFEGSGGSYDITVEASDGTLTSSQTFAIAITNVAPQATDKEMLVLHGRSKTGNLLTDATDPNGATLTVTVVNQPANGSVTYNATTGEFTYTAPLFFEGADNFTFKVSDGTNESELTTVEINVVRTVVWDNGGDGVNWDDPDNWNVDVLPGQYDPVFIGEGYYVVLNDSAEPAVVLTLACDGDLDVGGDLTLLGDSVISGWLGVAGNLTVAAMAHLSGGGDFSGQLDVQAGAVLEMAEGLFSALINNVFAGAGLVMVGATAPLPGEAATIMVASGTVQRIENFRLLDAGRIDGGGTLEVSDTFEWTGGSMLGAGRTVFEDGSVATISGNAEKQLWARSLENHGALTASGSVLQAGVGASIENWETFDIRDGFSITRGGGAIASFSNHGTFRKDQSLLASESLIGINFTNYGEVVVVTGFVAFDGTLTRHIGPAAVTRISEGAEVKANAFEMSGGEVLAGGLFETGGTLRIRTIGGAEARPGSLTWIEGTLVGTTLVLADDDTQMTISGALTLDSAKLDNHGLVLWVSGAIDALRNTTISNYHEFEIQCNANLTTDAGSDATFENTGLFKKVATAGVAQGTTDIRVKFESTGEVIVESGIIKFSGTGDYAGVFRADALASITFAGTTMTLAHGAAFVGGGRMVVGNGTMTLGSGVKVTSTTNFEVGGILGLDFLPASTGTLSGPGEFTNAGTATFSTGRLANLGLFVNSGDMTIATAVLFSDPVIDSSVLRNTGTLTWAGGSLSMSNTAQIVNRGTFDLTGDGTIVNAAGIPEIRNESMGVIRKTAGTLATVAVQTVNFAAISLDGTSIHFSASFSQEGGATVLNGGTLRGAIVIKAGDLEGAGSVVGSLSIVSDGRLLVGNDLIRVNGDVTQAGGAVQIGSDGFLDVVGSHILSAGEIHLGSGNGSLSTSQGLVIGQGASVSGIGTIHGNVTNNGLIDCGNRQGAPFFTGQLWIFGSFTQSSTGEVRLDVDTPGATGAYDILRVIGAATLAGKFTVRAGPGFNPAAGDQFDNVLVFAERSGLFDTIQLPPLNNLVWDLVPDESTYDLVIQQG